MSTKTALRAGNTTGRLVDRFGRVHTDLRISVTDRCNLRCTYCMPEEVVFRPREELLDYEEIARVVRVVAGLGIRTIRLTGGEPLVRRDLSTLVEQLVATPGIDEVAVTTNGLLLAEQAAALWAAGLTRLNVSLDSLRADVFEKIARRQGLDRVLAGLEAARRAGFGVGRSAGFGISRPAGFASAIRINAVSIRGLTEDEIVPLAEFCRREGFHLRFIEFMPLDADEGWERPQVLSGAEVREILETSLGPLTPVAATDPGQPATDYAWDDGGGRVGFINPVTQPFCDRCDRLRLTADGQFRNCLFSTVEWDVRGLLRGLEPADDAALAALVRDCVAAKKAAHGIDTPAFERPARAMYQIGG
jgi:cyclic pyranopterin phosphate synthase